MMPLDWRLAIDYVSTLRYSINANPVSAEFKNRIRVYLMIELCIHTLFNFHACNCRSIMPSHTHMHFICMYMLVSTVGLSRLARNIGI